MNAKTARLSSFAAILASLVLTSSAIAEDRSDPVVRFHRVFVPEDRIKDWPRGDAKYLPIDANEFERLVAAMKPHTEQTAPTPSAAVIAARYDAKLVGDRLTGRAALDVTLAAAPPTLLPLSPCNVAIGKAEWSVISGQWPVASGQTEEERGEGRGERGGKAGTHNAGDWPIPKSQNPKIPTVTTRAALGLTSDGYFGAIVEHSGRLNFDWSLAGHRDSSDKIDFSFELPAAPANRLFVELPNGFSPTVDRGLILGNEPASKASRRWQVELGGHTRFRLSVVSDVEARRRRQLALLRESRTYDCSLRGVEISVQWKLQVYNEPLRQITVLLDPGLQLLSARLGDAPIPWSAAPSAKGVATRITLKLPEPIRDTDRVIRLGAIGRPVFDKPWRLPRIRAEGLLWQEGSLSLLTPEPVEVDRITLRHCAQTGTGPLSSPRTGQSMQFQSFDADATVEVLLSRRSASVKIPAVPSSPPTAASMAQEPPAPNHATKAAADQSTTAARAAAAWIQDCRLESWFQTDGASRHVAAYDLQNAGRKRFDLTLPPEIAPDALQGIWVDGQSGQWRTAATEQGRIVSIAIPHDRRSLAVTIEWASSGPALGIAGSVVAAMPEAGLPIFGRHWIAWLPPGYENADSEAGTPSPDTEGWTSHSFDIAAGTPIALRYARIASMRLFAAVAFLLVASLGWWAVKRRMAVAPGCAALLGVFGAAVFALPDAYTPIAYGGLLGVLCCSMFRWIRRDSTAAPNPPTAVGSQSGNLDPGSTIAMVGRVGIMIFAALLSLSCCSNIVHGEKGPLAASENIATRLKSPLIQRQSPPPYNSPAAAPAVPSPSYRVLVPVDSHRKPVGGKVYVPENLYQELYRHAGLAEKLPSWLIVRAVYHGDLGIESGSGRLVATALRASYDLHVFDPGVRVRIPLQTDGANPLPAVALLDGRPIELEWDPNAGSLAFDVPEPSDYRLEVSLRPAMRGAGGVGRIRREHSSRAFRSLGFDVAGRCAGRRSAVVVWRHEAGKRAAASVRRSRSRRPIEPPMAGAGIARRSAARHRRASS